MSNEVVGRAILLATSAHRGQFRKYGNALGLQEPYIMHPARVAAMVAHGELFFPGTEDFFDILCAAWLHDVIEDTSATGIMIKNITNRRVLNLVEELTNPSKKFPHLKREERKKIDRDHCGEISRTAQLIKMFDRMDNLCGLVNAPPDFARLYLDESEALAEVLRPASRDLFNALAATINAARKIVDSRLNMS